MRTSDTLESLNEALMFVQSEIKNPSKDASGQVRGRQNYRYASLPSILAEVRPLLAKTGLAITQEAVGGSDGVGVVTRISHVSGEWMELGPLLMPPQTDAQQVGSALTYASRYALCAALAIAGDDDDGAQASGGTTATAATTARRSAQAGTDAAGGLASEPAPPEDVEPVAEGLQGEGSAAGSTPYLSDEQQERYAKAFGGANKLLTAAHKRYGESIRRLADLTVAQADQLIGGGS